MMTMCSFCSLQSNTLFPLFDYLIDIHSGAAVSNPNNEPQDNESLNFSFDDMENDPFGDTGQAVGFTPPTQPEASPFPEFDFGSADNSGSQFGDFPSPDAEETPAEEAAPVKGKKGKKPKAEKAPKKTKPPKEPRVPGEGGFGMPELGLLGWAAMVILGTLGTNLYYLLFHFSSSIIMYIVLFDIIAFVALLVPIVLWMKKSSITVFEVLLGVALNGVTLGALFVLTEWYKY